ncbi:MAG: threonine/serine exporter family protein [Clostridia bacterium]|nr:threonine/serine exporter family protein [Clostridia bacterium]
MNIEEIVSAALDIGEEMLVSGAEVKRVEDSVSRIIKAYIYGDVDVFTITSSIIVTVRSPKDGIHTQSRRILKHKTDLDRLSRLNNLSRTVCRELPPLESIEFELAKIKRNRQYSRFTMFFIYALVASSFTLFFGGTLIDGGVSAAVALVLCAMTDVMGRFDLNRIFVNMICSFAAGVLSILAVHAGLGHNLDMIIIGNIMLMIPGIALTNSIRDMISGDLMTGILRLVEALLLAVSIALGFSLAMIPLDALIISGRNAVQTNLLQLLWALLGSVSFAMLFNVRGRHLLISSLGGFFLWAVYLLCGNFISNEYALYFIAAAAATVYAEVFARVMKTPTTLFLVVAVIPLVPGGKLYYTMEHAVNGEMEQFFSAGAATMGFTVAIAAGILFISSVMSVAASLNKKYKITHTTKKTMR